MPLTVTPLTPVFCAEVTGVDITKPLDDATFAAIRKAFDALYEHRYQHSSPDEQVEVVNVRVAAIGKRVPLCFPTLEASSAARPAPRPT